MSSSKSHGKSIRGADFPGVNSVQKGVSLPMLQSTRVLVVSFLTSLSPVGWIAGGLFPNIPKSKENESSLFSSINQLLESGYIGGHRFCWRGFFFLEEKAGIAIRTLAHGPYGKKYDRF